MLPIDSLVCGKWIIHDHPLTVPKNCAYCDFTIWWHLDFLRRWRLCSLLLHDLLLGLRIKVGSLYLLPSNNPSLDFFLGFLVTSPQSSPGNVKSLFPMSSAQHLAYPCPNPWLFSCPNSHWGMQALIQCWCLMPQLCAWLAILSFTTILETSLTCSAAGAPLKCPDFCSSSVLIFPQLNPAAQCFSMAPKGYHPPALPACPQGFSLGCRLSSGYASSPLWFYSSVFSSDWLTSTCPPTSPEQINKTASKETHWHISTLICEICQAYH